MVASKSYSFCGEDFKEATLDRIFTAVVSTQENQFSKDKRFISAHNVRLSFTCSMLWTNGEALGDGRENSSAFSRQELEEERQGGAQDMVYFFRECP